MIKLQSVFHLELVVTCKLKVFNVGIKNNLRKQRVSESLAAPYGRLVKENELKGPLQPGRQPPELIVEKSVPYRRAARAGANSGETIGTREGGTVPPLSQVVLLGELVGGPKQEIKKSQSQAPSSKN